jgi:hypothetical protein
MRPNTWSSVLFILVVSAKMPWVEIIDKTVSKVFILSTSGNKSLPISVVSSLLQLIMEKENKKTRMEIMYKNLLCTIKI